MKTIAFGLFVLLQSSALFAQFDEAYLGYYTSDDGFSSCFISLYDDEYFSHLEMTEDQKKNCSFLFIFETREVEGSGFTTPKGDSFISTPNEYISKTTFSFRSEADGTRRVEIIEKSGKKTLLTQKILPVEEYGDEEPAIAQEDDEMETRSYSRSDDAKLIMVFSEELVVFFVYVPGSKSCPEVIVQGAFDSPTPVGNVYTYTSEDSSYTLEVKETDRGAQLKCIKGECFDKKNKCEIWKDAFVLDR